MLVLFSEETKYPDIRLTDFLNHVRVLHADSDNGFSNEFEDIASQTVFLVGFFFFFFSFLLVLFTEETKYPDIRLTDFLNHVRVLHADSDNGFSNEFEDIASQTVFLVGFIFRRNKIPGYKGY